MIAKTAAFSRADGFVATTQFYCGEHDATLKAAKKVETYLHNRHSYRAAKVEAYLIMIGWGGVFAKAFAKMIWLVISVAGQGFKPGKLGVKILEAEDSSTLDILIKSAVYPPEQHIKTIVKDQLKKQQSGRYSQVQLSTSSEPEVQGLKMKGLEETSNHRFLKFPFFDFVFGPRHFWNSLFVVVWGFLFIVHNNLFMFIRFSKTHTQHKKILKTKKRLVIKVLKRKQLKIHTGPQ